MPKRKHTCSTNASFKAHRNGIKKAPRHRFLGNAGLNQRVVKNTYYARLGNKSAPKAE